MQLSKKKIVDFAWKAIDRICLVILLILALMSVEDTLRNYVTKKSNRSVNRIPISEQPTVSICFDDDEKNIWNRKMFSLGTEVNITYYIYDVKTKEIESILLWENENLVPNSNTDLIHVQKMQSCYKITAKTSSGKYKHQSHQERFLKVSFSPSIETSKVPKRLVYYFTSEMNSYSVESKVFYDGKVSKMIVGKDQLSFAMIDKTKQTKLLSEKSGCLDDSSFWNSFQQIFVPAVREKCLKPCNPRGLPQGELDLCKNIDDWNCAEEKFSKILKSNHKDLQKNPCVKLEFDVSIQQSNPLIVLPLGSSQGLIANTWKGEPMYVLGYSFLTPESITLEEDYLILSFLDMVGGVGGNLGLFIEFSFHGFILDIFFMCKAFVLKRVRQCKYQKGKDNHN